MQPRNIVDVVNQIKPILEEHGEDTVFLSTLITGKEMLSVPDHVLWRALQGHLTHLVMNYTSEDFHKVPWYTQVSDIMTNKAALSG